MFDYDPVATLVNVEAPVVALSTADDEEGSRGRALARASAARVAVGRDSIAVTRFDRDGHNLMRYRPDAVSAAILAVAGEAER